MCLRSRGRRLGRPEAGAGDSLVQALAQAQRLGAIRAYPLLLGGALVPRLLALVRHAALVPRCVIADERCLNCCRVLSNESEILKHVRDPLW